MQIQLLRSHFDIKCDHGSGTHVAIARTFATCYAPCGRRNFKQNETAKIFASTNPSWACAYAPKMEEFCKTLFFRRSSSERRTRRFPKAAAFGVFSFAISLRRGKEMASLRHSERAKQCEPVEEAVKNLVSHTIKSIPPLAKPKNFRYNI